MFPSLIDMDASIHVAYPYAILDQACCLHVGELSILLKVAVMALHVAHVIIACLYTAKAAVVGYMLIDEFVHRRVQDV